jgi:hypothetical protein
MVRMALPMDERGGSLVEVVVSIVLLSIALSSLASLSYNVAQRSLDATLESHATGVVTEQLARLWTLPYDSVLGEAGCTAVEDGPFPHERCVTVTDPSNRIREIELVVTPRRSFGGPDTIIIQRGRPASANPFGS